MFGSIKGLVGLGIVIVIAVVGSIILWILDNA